MIPNKSVRKKPTGIPPISFSVVICGVPLTLQIKVMELCQKKEWNAAKVLFCKEWAEHLKSNTVKLEGNPEWVAGLSGVFTDLADRDMVTRVVSKIRPAGSLVEYLNPGNPNVIPVSNAAGHLPRDSKKPCKVTLVCRRLAFSSILSRLWDLVIAPPVKKTNSFYLFLGKEFVPSQENTAQSSKNSHNHTVAPWASSNSAGSSSPNGVAPLYNLNGMPPQNYNALYNSHFPPPGATTQSNAPTGPTTLPSQVMQPPSQATLQSLAELWNQYCTSGGNVFQGLSQFGNNFPGEGNFQGQNGQVLNQVNGNGQDLNQHQHQGGAQGVGQGGPVEVPGGGLGANQGVETIEEDLVPNVILPLNPPIDPNYISNGFSTFPDGNGGEGGAIQVKNVSNVTLRKNQSLSRHRDSGPGAVLKANDKQ